MGATSPASLRASASCPSTRSPPTTGARCATREVHLNEAELSPKHSSAVSLVALLARSVTINVAWHVINTGSGVANGDISAQMINDQIALLNTA